MRNRQVLFVHRPEGKLAESDFEMREVDVLELGSGQVLCRTILLSVDPANRAWMAGRTYRDQLGENEVMSGFTLSEVVDAGDTTLAQGTIVAGDGGWQEYAVLPAATLRAVDVRGSLTLHMSALGITGLTAYFGMLEVGRPAEGETVVVSAAAGATGSVAGQIARIQGARVVGISRLRRGTRSSSTGSGSTPPSTIGATRSEKIFVPSVRAVSTCTSTMSAVPRSKRCCV